MELKSVEKLEKSLVKLTIAVNAEEFEAATQAAYKKNVKSMTVPGFRKGKAPRKMVEQMYGASIFFEDAVNGSYPAAYEKALDEAKLEPVGRAEVDIDEVLEDGGYVFHAIVPVAPEVTVGEYKGLKAEKEKAEVSDKDIKAEIDKLAERASRTETVTRKIKKGDTANINFEGFVDGVAFDGGKGENFDLTIGSGQFIPGFEEKLIGAKTGDELDVEVSFPEEYHAEELKGKPAVFKCKVNEVKQTVKPEIDDEFAKDVSDFNTLDELKADLKAKMEEAKVKQVEIAFEEKLLDEVLATMGGEIPEVMYEAQTDRIVEDFAYRVQAQGMDFNQYIAMNGMDMDGFRKLFTAQAERQVKVRLCLEAIAKKEVIEISDQVVEEEYAKMAEQHKIAVEQVKAAVPAESIKHDMMMQKAIDVIKDNATVKKAAKKAKKDEE